jgi:hypothetical protein
MTTSAAPLTPYDRTRAVVRLPLRLLAYEVETAL